MIGVAAVKTHCAMLLPPRFLPLPDALVGRLGRRRVDGQLKPVQLVHELLARQELHVGDAAVLAVLGV